MNRMLCARIVILASMLFSCEKEIKVDLPKEEPELVVEGCINNTILSLNYVFVSQTVDYFNPNLNLLGVDDALVYITEGVINGADTLFNISDRVRFFQIPVENYPTGVYLFPGFLASAEKAYKLEVFYQDKLVVGYTTVPTTTPIVDEQVTHESFDKEGYPRFSLTIKYVDPQGPSYYRLATTVNKFPLMLGFGEAHQLRRLDDSQLDNQEREYKFTNSYSIVDTVNVYLCRLGVREFKFWESFASAQNNDGPFSTPVQLNSTVKGGIGSFTGYNIDYKQVIINER